MTQLLKMIHRAFCELFNIGFRILFYLNTPANPLTVDAHFLLSGDTVVHTISPFLSVITCIVSCFVSAQADFPTVIGVTLDREDGSTPMETDGEKTKQSGTTYFIDTNQLRVPRESMEVMSPLKNGMSEC